MNKYRFIVFAAILLCMLGAQVASAQNIAAYQGNGQLICIGCNTVQLQGVNTGNAAQFSPLFVKVTDNSGNPVANATVTWGTSGFTICGSSILCPSNMSSVTDANGIAYASFTAFFGTSGQFGPTQNVITATVQPSGAFTTFTLTQASPNQQNDPMLDVVFPVSGTTISGNAGSTGSPIQIQVAARGNTLQNPQALAGPVSNVSIKLINYQTNATVTCATSGTGADPGSALSDNTGTATCNPVFGGNGNGQYAILVGGSVWTTATYSDGTLKPQPPPYTSVVPNRDPTQPQATFAGWGVSNVFNEQITPAVVGTVAAVSGNNQTANQGQALAAPLVASVTSTAGNPISGQAVTWSVSPTGAATLTNTSTTTDVNGHASTNVTLSSSASGTVTVTMTASGKTVSFTMTAVIPTQLSSLTKASGDTQTAIEGAAFANPLVVQVAVSSGSVANQVVAWTLTGPGTLSATSTPTDANGRASVTVTAGSTAGTVTVVATVGNLSPVTFTLTVAPPGPLLSSGTFENGADFQKGSISPCSIATVIASGLAPSISGVVTSFNLVGYLNYTVATDTVTVGGAQAPIYNVANVNGTQQVTFQVPCSVTPGTSVPVVVTVGTGSATVNTTVLPASPGVFQSQYTINVQGFGTLPVAVVLKPDGTLVSPSNPARQGEKVVAYVTGMGPTLPSVATNALPPFGGVPSTVTDQVIVGVNNAGVPVNFAQLSEDLIGVYLVGFTVPTGVSGNVVFSIGVVPTGSSTPYYSNPAAIYIQ